MVTGSLMQNMVQICKKNTYFVTKLLFNYFRKSYVGALGIESPHSGAIVYVYLFKGLIDLLHIELEI